MTDNKCVICGEEIRKNYKPSPTDKPSARIKCFDCIKKGVSKMDYEEAIQTIKNNYPPENYTMLREALDLAIELMEKQINK